MKAPWVLKSLKHLEAHLDKLLEEGGACKGYTFGGFHAT
jgi:hypothetical protein